MKRKIISIILFFTLILLVAYNVIATDEPCKILIYTINNEVKASNTIDVYVKLSDVVDNKGIAGYSAKLSYDDSIFEFYKINKIGKWDEPIYNEGSFSSVVSSGEGENTNQNCALITLKVKSDAKPGEYKITLSEVVVSNGEESFDLSPSTTDIKIEETNSTNENKTNTNSTNENETDTNSTNTNSTNENETNTNNTNENGTNTNNTNESKTDTNSINSNGTYTNNTNSNKTGSNSTQTQGKNSPNSSSQIIPYAGIGNIIKIVVIIIILTVIVIGVVNLYKYRK